MDIYVCGGNYAEKLCELCENLTVAKNIKQKDLLDYGFTNFSASCFYKSWSITEPHGYPVSCAVTIRKENMKIESFDLLDKAFMEPHSCGKEEFNQIEAIIKKMIDDGILWVRKSRKVTMNNYMKQIADMLGVELDEEFRIKEVSPAYYYKFSDRRLLLYVRDKDGRLIGSCDAKPQTLEYLLTGKYTIIKMPWKPAENEIYFIPRIDKPEMACWNIWGNSKTDISRYNLGIVCKAKKDAVAIAKKMLAAIKE